MTYIVCFLLTIFLTILSELCFKKKNKFLGCFFALITIFIPSYIAGVRNLDVGRDIKLYVDPIVNAAKNVNFQQFINITNRLALNYGELEFGYNLCFNFNRIYCFRNFNYFFN